ncbi:MAG: hypothetical protein H7338_02435 [Candidatus Sericytochromatia bacterium]|nr:hypothetical protein [Candidatus Sericytochromatia bacterium]
MVAPLNAHQTVETAVTGETRQSYPADSGLNETAVFTLNVSTGDMASDRTVKATITAGKDHYQLFAEPNGVADSTVKITKTTSHGKCVDVTDNGELQRVFNLIVANPPGGGDAQLKQDHMTMEMVTGSGLNNLGIDDPYAAWRAKNGFKTYQDPNGLRPDSVALKPAMGHATASVKLLEFDVPDRRQKP